MRSQSLKFFILCSILLFSFSSHARTFKNAYISFEMLDTWKCKLEQTEWVCRSEDPQESKEAVIILTAKEKGPSDSFPIYQEHMAKPMTLNLKSGGATQSKVVKPPREETYNGHIWLNAMHVNSEVQNYYTLYAATVKDQIAILITFSAHTSHFAKHGANFNKTIQSLRVIATKDILSQRDLGPIRGSGEFLGDGISQAIPSDLLAGDDELSSSGKKGLLQNEMFLGFLLLLLAAGAYIGVKVYQNKNK